MNSTQTAAVATSTTGARHTTRRNRTAVVSPKTRGVSALMYACQQGDVDRVRRILKEQPFALKQRDRTGKSPLHYCTTSDYITAAQAADLLVMAAPDLVDGHDDEGFTPLHLAVIAGNMPLVTFLLANNADINAVDSERHTVVHWATVCGETEALRAVLSAGAPVSTPDIHGGYPLHYAAQMCGGEKDSLLGLQVLHTLLSHQDIVVSVEDGDRRQPLLWAASAGSAKAILALVRAGAAVEAPDRDGLTALHCAASRGHTDCIDTLLTLCGASPDVIDSNGCTALHYAVTLGHADATVLLLNHGANPNRQDRKGRSPAHCGCAKGQFETVKILASHDANLWLRNARGDLPLHEAAASGRRDLVRWLLEARPSQVNARNNDGRCPLHLAALNDNADMCKILLDAGSQVNPVLRTSKNRFMTPLDCALQRGFRSTAKYLQLHGGVPSNRLAGLRSTTDSGASSSANLNIRDDVTIWGDTSTDSERENADNGSEERRKRMYKRKVAYRYERNDVEAAKMKKSSRGRKSGEKTKGVGSKNNRSEVLRYSSEVVVSDRGSRVNIEQNGEIMIKDKGAKRNSSKIPIVSPSKETKQGPEIKERRPRSAKFGKQREREAKLKTQTLKKDTKAQIPTEKIKSSTDEVSIKETAKNISKTEENILTETAVKNETHKTQEILENVVPKIETLTPKETTTETVVQKEIAKAVVQSSPSITSNDEDAEQKTDVVVEAHVHSPPKTKSKSDNQASSEEGKTKEDGVRETKEGEITAMDKGDQEDSERKSNQEKVAEDGVKEVEGISTKQVVEDAEKIDDVLGRKDESETTKVYKDEIKSITENSILDTKQKQSDIEEVKTITKVERTEVHTEKMTEEKEETNDTKETEYVEKTSSITVAERSQATATSTETVKGKQLLKQSTVLENDEDQPVTAPAEAEKITKESEQEKILQETAETSEAILDSQQQSEVSAVPAPRISETKEPKQQSDEKDTTVSDSSKKSKKTFLKTTTKPTPTESSAEIKTSEEASSSGSSNSSKESKKEHKSFRVLDDEEFSKEKTKSGRKNKPNLQKRRSRSEETPKPTQETEHSKTKIYRSKIPTPRFDVKPRLSKSERHLDKYDQTSSEHLRTESNMSAPMRGSVYSDNERGSGSDMEESVSSATRKKRLKKRGKTRGSKSAGSDYESSNLIDSGFEPSPRSSRHPKCKNMSDRGVNMASVTQTIQTNIRRYHLERKIFQHLLDLKRLQIRAGQHNEAILVKRAIDTYHKSCASTVGAGRYIPEDYTFKSFEQFLYHALRKLQKNNGADCLKGLPETPDNPLLCTRSTNRCMHATHAYTGVPCAAYLPRMDHHTIPKIGFNDCKPSGFLPQINSKKAVTLELCHGNEKQIIQLPTARLDQNKRYYVTFTVKGQDEGGTSPNEETKGAHIHSRSE